MDAIDKLTPRTNAGLPGRGHQRDELLRRPKIVNRPAAPLDASPIGRGRRSDPNS